MQKSENISWLLPQKRLLPGIFRINRKAGKYGLHHGHISLKKWGPNHEFQT